MLAKEIMTTNVVIVNEDTTIDEVSKIFVEKISAVCPLSTSIKNWWALSARAIWYTNRSQ